MLLPVCVDFFKSIFNANLNIKATNNTPHTKLNQCGNTWCSSPIMGATTKPNSETR